MRKYYIDNLRIFCIFLLFPFHTTMIFNNQGEIFYVNGAPKELLTFVNLGVYGWWMTGLFVLAGMSTMYALEHRTGRQYIQERVHKLLIPLISCLIFVVPLQTYIADRFHNGYTGNYFEHFNVFLTITDFGGYDGHFTPAHTWFVLYLFIISIAVLPLLLWYKKRERKMNSKWLTMPVLLLLGVPVAFSNDLLNVGGKSFAQFGLCFLIGYFVLSDEQVQKRLETHSQFLGIAWLLLIITRCSMHACGYHEGFLWNLLYYSLSWVGILAMIGLGRRYLNHNWKFTKHFVKAEFPLYLFHQTIVIVFGYLLIPVIPSAYLQYILIILLSFVCSYLLYQLCRRFRITRFLFAIKK